MEQALAAQLAGQREKLGFTVQSLENLRLSSKDALATAKSRRKIERSQAEDELDKMRATLARRLKKRVTHRRLTLPRLFGSNDAR